MRNRKVLLKCRLCVTNEEPDKRTVPLSGFTKTGAFHP